MTVKKLFLIRHGKAEDYSFLKKDYDRNLIEKGQKRTALIAQKLIAHLSSGKTQVVSSTANRALQTAQLCCEVINYPQQHIQLEKGIYEAYYSDILRVINAIPDDVQNVLVFGHNPGLSDLTNYLCHSAIDLKTAHVAKIILAEGFNYQEISGGTCHLEAVITE